MTYITPIFTLRGPLRMTFHVLQKKATVGIVILACMAGFELPAAAKKNKLNPAAVALFEKAIQESDLRGEDGTAYRLQATIHIFNWQRQRIDGILVEFWAPGGKVRTEVMLPGYNYLRISDGHHSWKKSSEEYTPYPVSQLFQVMGFVGAMRSLLPPDKAPAKGSPEERNLEKVELGKPKKENGASGECVKARTWYGSEPQYCFDPATGQLTQIVNWFRYEYGDYQAFGKNSFPRSMSILYHNGSEMEELQVSRVDPLEAPDPTLFVPAPGSQEEKTGTEGCKKSTPAGKNGVIAAKLTRMVQPVYPVEAKKDRISGRVIIHAIIGKDGVPHELWVVQSPAPILSAAALAATRQWRYRPTMLCGEPVPVDTMLTVIFSNP